METLLLPFSPRFIVLTICAVITALLLGVGIFDHNPKAWEVVLIPIIIFGALTLLGIRDLLQKGHAVLRNYPISAHIRFLLEEIRPEMRQYFFESEKDGMPFSRDTRALVYQRAKMVLDKRPFGTQEDVYRDGYEWMHHSMAPKPRAVEQFRITIGGPDCTKPYSASVFNISAMSFGALSPNAVRALNTGAKRAASRMTPARAASVPIIARTAATSSGRSAPAISAAATATDRSTRKNSPASPADDRSTWSSSRSARAPSPAMAACCRRPRCRKRFPRSGASPWARIASRRPTTGVFDAGGDDGLHRRDAAAIRRQAGRIQALHRSSLGVPGDLQGDAAKPASIPTSSSSTAMKAAPARRRWSSWTIWACRCARA